jgi:hypothetical protein
MKSGHSGTAETFKIETGVLNLAVLLFLFRLAIPFLKYPFLVLYPVIIIFSLIKYRNLIALNLTASLRTFLLPLILFIIIIVQFFLSNKIYLVAFKDIANVLILFSCFFIYLLIIRTGERFNYLYTNLLKTLIVFAFIISVFNLFILLDIMSFIDLAPNSFVVPVQGKLTLDIDNNFALLPLFFGILSIFYFQDKTESKPRKTILVLMLSLFTLGIILSASRRGLTCLMIIILILILARAVSMFKIKKWLEFLGKINSMGNRYFLSLGILILVLFISLRFTDYNSKSRVLQFLGTRNPAGAFNRVTMNLFRYVQVYDENMSYSDFYKKIWRPVFDPLEPDRGWGTRRHTTLAKLAGENVGIVPDRSKGYLLDSTCNADNREGNAYAYTQIWSNNKKIKVIGATVYCYVSDTFNGDYAMMAYEMPGAGYKRVSYDLSQKGTWQKLTLDFDYKIGEYPCYFYIAKFGVTDFSTLKGYVVFAHPQLNSIENDSLCALKKQINNASVTPNRHNLYYSSLASPPKIKIRSLTHFVIKNPAAFSDSLEYSDRDPIRRWVSGFIAEDTTYFDLQSSIRPEISSDNFVNLRKIRWDFAIQIFTKEYNLSKKFFGNGFNFLNWYGNYFLEDKTESDWPHNPFLSILLYSGIFGLLIYVFFLYKVSIYYFRCIKDFTLLPLFFILTFFFSFFSGSSPFDPPIMGFFAILPFFVSHVFKIKDKHNLALKTDE